MKLLLRSSAKSGTWLALLLASIAGSAAHAVDMSFSGYGTVGYAESNRSYAYQRFIDDQGSFKRDTLFGAQADFRFSPQWSATVQAKVAPRTDSDRGWKTNLPWAFVSWRPDNDWLFRLGKLRVPGYMNSENMDVGVTFDFARLPHEMYSVSPVMDFNGLSANRTWRFDEDELSVEGYAGKAKAHWRYNYREGLAGFFDAGPYYMPITLRSLGGAVTWRHDEDVYRIGYHKGTIDRADDYYIPASFPYVQLFPTVGYYQVDNRIPGPGLENKKTLGYSVLYLGADVGLPNDFRLLAEFGRRRLSGTSIGPNTDSQLLSLRKRIGAWTPYLVYSSIRSQAAQIDTVNALNAINLPSQFPMAAQLNAAQRLGADNTNAYDQHTWAVGTSYRLSPTSLVKAEWGRTKIGATSTFVDSPARTLIKQQDIDVLSLSYSFVF